MQKQNEKTELFKNTKNLIKRLYNENKISKSNFTKYNNKIDPWTDIRSIKKLFNTLTEAEREITEGLITITKKKNEPKPKEQQYIKQTNFKENKKEAYADHFYYNDKLKINDTNRLIMLDDLQLIYIKPVLKAQFKTSTIYTPTYLPDNYTEFFIGGISKLKKLYIAGHRNITVNFYEDPLYVEDRPFKKIKSSDDLSKLLPPKKGLAYDKSTFKGYKDRLTYYAQVHRGSGRDAFFAELVLTQRTEPQQHIQAFKDNINYNCFIKAVETAMTDGQREKTINKDVMEQLNKKYFSNGVRCDDIPDIEKKLKINITIKNRIDAIIYNSININKRQNIILTTPYIDHIEYIKLSTNKKEKTATQVPDITYHYNNNDCNFKYFKKDIEQKLIYYFDGDNIYYEPFKINDIIVNNDKYFIYDLETYHQDKFIDENNLNFNSIFYNDDKFIFNEINNTPHHIYQYIFNNNITIKEIERQNDNPLDYGLDNDEEAMETTKQYNINNYYTIDNNKNFIGFINQSTPAYKYYDKYQIPANGKYTAYNVGTLSDEEKEIILNTTSIIKINNIILNNKIIEDIEYFINGNNYTTAIIKYCLDNDIIKSFDIELIITFDEIQLINFSNEIIDNKFYNKIIGLMHHKQINISSSFEYKNISDLQDILYYNENIIYNIENKTVTITRPNENISNRAHISSFIMSYAFINILDVLKNIEYNNIIALTADAITTKEPINAVLNNKPGNWKKQTKDILITRTIYNYINMKEDNEEENKLYNLTSTKLKYKKVNLISGEAGTGKTTQFLKPFETDERLYNSLLLLPTNELLYGFNKEYPDVNKMTYQNFIKETDDKSHYAQIRKYKYIIIDEASMISNVDIEKILLLTLKQRQKAIIIGDFDIKRRELYQLKPIKDAPFFYIFDNKNNIILSSANKWVPEKDIFYKHLTQNRRQGADLNFNKFLKNMRGKENNYIKQSILNNPMFKKISFDDALKKYKLGDKILCSTNEEINKANKNMNLEGDQIQILYKATLGGHAKNETAIINKNEYNDLIMKLGYAQTAHSAQGQTYNNNIFISINRLFTDNLLYVMLSRTKTSEQIYIIDH